MGTYVRAIIFIIFIMKVKAAIKNPPGEEVLLDQIKTGQVRGIFVDLDGTLVDSALRVEIMSRALKEHGLPEDLIKPERLFKAAQKAGSFAFKKIWNQKDLKEALSPFSGELDKNIETLCLKEFCKTLDKFIKNPEAYKEEIHGLAAEGSRDLLRASREAGVPVIACTNAENKLVAQHTKRIVETAAERRFTDVMYSDRPVLSKLLEIDALGQAILENKTSDSAGKVALKGKPSADMLAMAALRIALFRAAAGEELLPRNAASAPGEKPVFIFVGDQRADYEASKALQNIFDKNGIGCTVNFVAITGTGGTEAAMQLREAEWNELGVTHFRTLEPLAGALKESRKGKDTKAKESFRPLRARRTANFGYAFK